MLQNAYFLAKIGADTAKNEQNFAEILPKTGNYPTGPPIRRQAAAATAGGGRAAGVYSSFCGWKKYLQFTILHLFLKQKV